ncbi:putative basic amino acid antiporter YfcC [Treponema sp. OMZ 792]|uniref:YfcC family protein n=1 Tax=unclassified Treponema TaxID=2638727 RepID=UPI0020A4B7D9|nr:MULTISPECIES: AbgT family transporter [unclassified Treponema]UTC75825.1 putative basic amino acid antiporter YfcC [Treponema sp. OMZ 792]UTC79825.1 putative basic amino acid antiporter YfcC [Treponema sp. OMZ 798]
MDLKVKRFKLKAPDAIVLILVLLILASIFTYVLPTGEYTRVLDSAKGVNVVDPYSYHPIERNPVSFWGILQAVPRGLNESAEIINFLLIIGGIFGILKGTGALDSVLKMAMVKLKGRERLIIPVILIFWGLGGAIIGNFEECLAFLPLHITLCLALGFDSITGVALGMCGVGVGYIGAILNPFTIITAQKIADVPILSGIELRIVSFIVLMAITIVYIYIYAGKIQKNPKLSPMYEQDLKSPYRENDLLSKDIVFTLKQKLSLAIFVLGIVVLVYGVVVHHFYLTEIAAVFVGTGILCGLAGGLSLNETVRHFVKGAENLVYAAICVGFARAITVIMMDGKILDVIVYGFSNMVQGLPLQISAVGMFVLQSFINIFIPSGTGQAVISMPIMTPLADVIGLTRQTAVLAFQFGDGITNLFTPTAGDLMAAIAIGGISYGKWFKWFWKLMGLWYIACSIILIIATIIGYGPV